MNSISKYKILLMILLGIIPFYGFSQKNKSKEKKQRIYASTGVNYIRNQQYFKTYLYSEISVGYYSQKNWINEIQLDFIHNYIGSAYGGGLSLSKKLNSRISAFVGFKYIPKGQFDYADIPNNLFHGGYSSFYKTKMRMMNVGVSLKLYAYKKSGFNMDIATGYSTIYKNSENQPHQENKNHSKIHVLLGLKYKYNF